MRFEWGRHDCCLFAADWVRECLGVDPAAAVRGNYSSALGAGRVSREAGCPPETHGAEWWPGHAGLEEIAPLRAQRGDLVSVAANQLWTPNAAGMSLGIVTGRTAAAPGMEGLVFLSLHQWRRAWRVGR